MVKMVEVIVTDRSGKIIKRVAVNEDLFNYVLERSRYSMDLTTVWFLRILRALFEATGAGGNTYASFIDLYGTSRTQIIKGNMGTVNYVLLNTYNCSNKLWISYGNSSTAPTRTDYKLGSKLGEGVAGVTADETQATVTISASFTMSADTTIYEVGLEWEACVGTYPTCGRLLLDRTVFSDGITVLAGQTITIVYRFFFP
jgi:hypothetical protein